MLGKGAERKGLNKFMRRFTHDHFDFGTFLHKKSQQEQRLVGTNGTCNGEYYFFSFQHEVNLIKKPRNLGVLVNSIEYYFSSSG